MITQLITAVIFAIIVSGLCSVFEAVLLSVSHGHVEVLAQSGKLSGSVLKKLKHDIQRPITAILTLNTIANTMGAAVAGAAAASIFGEQYLIWFSIAFTLAILLFSEILPKTIGVVFNKELASWIAIPVNWMTSLLYPIVWLCKTVTKLLPTGGNEVMVSAEEVLALTSLSRKSGEIDFQEEKVIRNVLSLKDRNVRQAMTPRTVTFTLNESLTLEQSLKFQDLWDRHSRVPVYDKGPDDIVGIVLRKDLLQKIADDQEHLRMSDIMKPVHFVPEYAPLTYVLLDFFEFHQHLFVVVDEYGGFTGVISLEDIIEEIVGREIMDETDQAINMRELARKKRKDLSGGQGETKT